MPRLFVGLELSPDTKRALARAQDKLAAHGLSKLSWVDPEKLHLTLKFLGSVDEALLPVLTQNLKDACHGFPASSAVLSNLGCFPTRGQVRVVWAGLEQESPRPLADLAARIDQALMSLGYQKEDRPFSPHITLARARKPIALDTRSIIDAAKLEAIAASWKLLSLFESKMSPTGSEYRVIESFELS
ncbi:MAG: RNA 2',3'-cyclic phosphodiesterase [Proteobacteria bacterium]|nr:MAG: RNA 2',3'-cyclic phosphodiesterase [Pseudomonadota bacterium]